ncbi:MAG: protein kinase domain-containing protein [Gemmataceae bacterium]
MATFLPPADHPLYLAVLSELVRVDLEYSWQRGQPHPLNAYRVRFPELFQNPTLIREIAFEEYRLRLQAGEAVLPSEYRILYHIETRDWPLPLMENNGIQAEAKELIRAVRDAAWPDGEQGLAPTAARDQALAPASPEQAQDAPAAGRKFLDFELLRELGRGAFATVYLARQDDLANRYVALKITTETFTESHTLAQLQHTNIVPIYSLHQSGRFQAVCMPYFGATTLADLLRDWQQRGGLPDSGRALVSTLATRKGRSGLTHVEWPGAVVPAVMPEAAPSPGADTPSLPLRVLERMSYGDAVLWIGLRLADGLAHAHERGILHRDLKPANILLTDEGQPMLLDFNLSQDVKQRDDASATLIGGTLPYMAPEHLDAFQKLGPGVDARGDVYALGVILYELLTGRLPYPTHKGRLDDVLQQMRVDRRQPPPSPRHHNPTLSPAVSAIVQHCLEPDAARRYQSAAQLRDDLERQLAHLPLRHIAEPSWRERGRKWLRRHPRLSVTLGGILVAVTVGSGLGGSWYYREHHLARVEAVQALTQFQADRRQVQFLLVSAPTAAGYTGAEGDTRCAALLRRYHVLDHPAWYGLAPARYLPAPEKERLRQDVAELLLLWSRLTIESATATSGAEAEQALRQALRLNHRAEECYGAGPAPRVVWTQRAEIHQRLGETAEEQAARQHADQATGSAPRDLCLQAGEWIAQGRHDAALPLLRQATRQEPDNFWAWFDRGICHENLAQYADAAACYGTCTALTPDFAPLYWKRGIVALRQKLFTEALADFDRALELQPRQPLVHADRALAHLELKQYDAAIQDLNLALEKGAPATRVYLLRARVHQLAGHAADAQEDLLKGQQVPPTDEAGWLAFAYARMTQQPEEALKAIDQALALNPRSAPALQNKAHILAERLGQHDEAIQTLTRLLALYPDDALALAGRGVLLARQGKRDPALKDAIACLSLSTTPPLLYQVACIYAQTSRQEPDDQLEALRLLAAALRRGYGQDLLATDRDLDPLRRLPRFQQLLMAPAAPR